MLGMAIGFGDLHRVVFFFFFPQGRYAQGRVDYGRDDGIESARERTPERYGEWGESGRTKVQKKKKKRGLVKKWMILSSILGRCPL